MRKNYYWIIDMFKDVLLSCVILAAVLFFNREVIINALVPSSSMENTIMTGDLVMGSRWNKNEIHRYDIVIFKYPDDESKLFIKRVIGLPGETITIKNGSVYADGTVLRDNFVYGKANRAGDGTYIVPKEHYFMMGDNRNHSDDSRFWKNKYVDSNAVIAKAWLQIWPINRWKVF